ncbi:MAG TPA: helix-hairpin-helix domain-containing protein, partial [Ideonella sp.]|nr:helix-hairpin-helix domain-containing protein [Ideonella sp.]
RGLGIHQPGDLLGRDPLALYRGLERHTGKRQDPCVLDTFMAVVDFMHGAAPKPWWAYTAERKRLHGPLHGPAPTAPPLASPAAVRAPDRLPPTEQASAR